MTGPCTRVRRTVRLCVSTEILVVRFAKSSFLSLKNVATLENGSGRRSLLSGTGPVGDVAQASRTGSRPLGRFCCTKVTKSLDGMRAAYGLAQTAAYRCCCCALSKLVTVRVRRAPFANWLYAA